MHNFGRAIAEPIPDAKADTKAAGSGHDVLVLYYRLDA